MAVEGLKSYGFHLKVFRRHSRVGSKILTTLVRLNQAFYGALVWKPEPVKAV